MSVFYDEASLVVVPSGYKSGKIYAQKPLTTDGQLTFTRSSTATRVNASGLIESVASGVPRLDYTNSTCPKLLLEPQRTNVALHSEDYTNAAWLTNASPTITANTTISPDGTTTADTITATGSFSGVYQSFASVNNATQYSWSVYIKNISSASNIFLGAVSNPANATLNIDATAGTIIGTGGDITGSSITSVGSGWYRVSGTYVSTGTSTAFAIYGMGSMSFAIWGAQLEAGAYPSSYVKTEAAAVTRLADSASKTGISSLIGQTEGTLFLEFEIGRTPISTDRVLILSDGTGNERIGISLGATGLLYAFVVDGGATQAEIIRSSTTAGTYKAAFAYKANDFVFYVNGVQVGTDTAGTIPSCSRYDLGQQLGDGELGGRVNQSLLFKTRLSNAKLAELTTL